MPFKEAPDRDFSGGSVDKNSPCNSEHMGSISSQGTRIIHVTEQLSPPTTATGTSWPQLLIPCATSRVHALQQNIPHEATHRSYMLQLRVGAAK